MSDESHDPFAEREPEIAGDEKPPAKPATSQPSAGIAWGAILLLVGIALTVVFAVQNTATVPVKFLWLEGEFSLAIVILVAVGAIVLITELIGVSYRRRRRRLRSEKEELKRLRGGP